MTAFRRWPNPRNGEQLSEPVDPACLDTWVAEGCLDEFAPKLLSTGAEASLALHVLYNLLALANHQPNGQCLRKALRLIMYTYICI